MKSPECRYVPSKLHLSIVEPGLEKDGRSPAPLLHLVAAQSGRPELHLGFS
jgi:hypothetical protein